MDIHWQNHNSFAACSNNTTICVCRLGLDKPIKIFKGHEGEVNVIRWDPTGYYLASGSDDHTARIWILGLDHCVHTLTGHKGSVEVIRWSPHKDRDRRFHLATASQDATVKLWHSETGQLLQTYNRHTSSVLSIAFSPCGRYLASGSLDRCFKIWSVEDGTLENNYQSGGIISEVCWNTSGDKIAASSADTNVIVLQLTKTWRNVS